MNEKITGLRCQMQGEQLQTDISSAIADEILLERLRQVRVEGRTPERDDLYADGEMALAAVCYAMSGQGWKNKLRADPIFFLWPWDWRWWKPTTPRRNLVKAAALIVAEIERLDRAVL